MDSTFIPVTIAFAIFIIIAYYLSVIRLSIPLIMIYLFYCFSYFLNNNLNNDNQVIITKKSESNNFNKLDNISSDSIKKSIKQKDNKNDPKPIVSFSPKPIVMDSSLASIIIKDTNQIINDKPSNTKIINSKKEKDLSQRLKLNEIMICRGIYKRNPIKPGIRFINNVDSLFCYTKISNSGTKQEVRHIWYYENKEVTTVSYNIKPSYNYRSWSKKTIYPNQTGNWRVDVVNKSGDLLGTRDFTINSINSTY
tara:strand:- start:3903 stop:4658 length:756 start_codon:yes stop_codon:yes gene_type:complete